ncbi:hypothetical protein VNO77_42302 [Canavalia gladiata]|uniref:Uncharacterized protein n=1 Tax=Canavalia gladiata TaxID=3824 RepID=A0AAN9K0S5_CANGL
MRETAVVGISIIGKRERTRPPLEEKKRTAPLGLGGEQCCRSQKGNRSSTIVGDATSTVVTREDFRDRGDDYEERVG